jgi:hypothetical protein
MPIWKLQTSIWNDTLLPRDAFTITPHFNDQGVGTDPQGLCEDLAAAISAWCGPLQQVTVKAYDAQGTPPVYPAGEDTAVLGNFGISSSPREVALCLSFFSTRNIPRQRGRLYIPGPLIGGQPGVVPSTNQQDKVAALVPIFTDLGGVDVDWCIWSRRDQVARPVTNWWIDNEWDTVRSRGLRATGRQQGTTSEG